jgi:CRP-like cAMP-binding protein
MAEKISSDSELRTLLSIHNASKRVLALLQSLKTIKTNGEVVVERLPTHQEIAIMINTSRETVTRTLLSLKQQGIIIKHSRTITIQNPNALQQLMQDV